MKIGIDCHAIGSGLGGNESYVRDLVSALLRIDRHNEYILYFTRRSPRLDAFGEAPNVTLVRVIPHSPYGRFTVGFPIQLRRHRPDLLHVQYLAPLFTPVPVVPMIHDLASITLPQFFTRHEHWRNRLLLGRAIRRAARVLTVSEYCREEILACYDVPSDKVVTVYCGVSEQFRRVGEADVTAVLQRYAIEGPFILYVGNIQPRKNLRGVLAAFAQLKRDRAVPHRLVIVGRKAWLYSDVFETVRTAGLEGDVTFTGYVPDEHLPALYSGASVFVFPSFFEGFGAPPLEAMRCGTPVVVSDRPALSEVVGDAAMLVAPDSPADIARGIWEVLSDRGVGARLVRAGYERASRYDWEKAARATLREFERVVDPVGRRTSQGPHAP